MGKPKKAIKTYSIEASNEKLSFILDCLYLPLEKDAPFELSEDGRIGLIHILHEIIEDIKQEEMNIRKEMRERRAGND